MAPELQVHDVDGVESRVLHPGGSTAGLPLVLLLHGAGSSSETLARQAQAWSDDWAAGRVPACVVACASTPTIGGFYIGPWERFIADTLPRFVGERHGVDLDRVALTGASMGGYGALKLAFARPERYRAVAAIAPVLFPGDSADDVPDRNKASVLSELHAAMVQSGWEEEHVVTRLRRNVERLRELPIYVECGGADAFHLHDGAEHLHRALWDLGLPHEYRILLGVDLVGPETADREAAARGFIAPFL